MYYYKGFQTAENVPNYNQVLSISRVLRHGHVHCQENPTMYVKFTDQIWQIFCTYCFFILLIISPLFIDKPLSSPLAEVETRLERVLIEVKCVNLIFTLCGSWSYASLHYTYFQRSTCAAETPPVAAREAPASAEDNSKNIISLRTF